MALFQKIRWVSQRRAARGSEDILLIVPRKSATEVRNLRSIQEENKGCWSWGKKYTLKSEIRPNGDKGGVSISAIFGPIPAEHPQLYDILKLYILRNASCFGNFLAQLRPILTQAWACGLI